MGGVMMALGARLRFALSGEYDAAHGRVRMSFGGSPKPDVPVISGCGYSSPVRHPVNIPRANFVTLDLSAACAGYLLGSQFMVLLGQEFLEYGI